MTGATPELLSAAIQLQEIEQTEASAILDEYTADDGLLADLVDSAVGLAEMEICLHADFPVDCEAGCVWCCYQRVTASPAEVLRIALFLRQTMDAEELEALIEHISVADQQTRGLDRMARLQLALPCPLLDGAGRCLAYPVRPLTCRGYTSSDSQICRAVVEEGASSAQIEADPVRYLFCQGVLNGLDVAVRQRAHEGGMVELVAALSVALTEPTAVKRWRRGEEVFAAAQVPAESILPPVQRARQE